MHRDTAASATARALLAEHSPAERVVVRRLLDQVLPRHRDQILGILTSVPPAERAHMLELTSRKQEKDKKRGAAESGEDGEEDEGMGEDDDGEDGGQEVEEQEGEEDEEQEREQEEEQEEEDEQDQEQESDRPRARRRRRHHQRHHRSPSRSPRRWPHAFSSLQFPALSLIYLAVAATASPGLLFFATHGWTWLLTAQPGPVVMPPTHVADSVLNETLRRGEAAAAARLAPPLDPYKMHRLGRQSDMVLAGVQKAAEEYGSMWPANTPNKTVIAHWDELLDVQSSFSGPVRQTFYQLDAYLSNAMWGAAERVNTSSITVANALAMTPAAFAAHHAPPRNPLAAFLATLWPTHPSTANPALRDRLLWSEVCACQLYLLRTNAKLLTRIAAARAALSPPEHCFEPIRAFLYREVSHRRATTNTTHTQLRRAYAAAVTDWSTWTPSLWRNSTWPPVRAAGWLLGGAAPPPWPAWQLGDAETSLATLEAAQAHLVLTRAHLDDLERHVERAAAAVVRVDDRRAEQHRKYARWPCEGLGGGVVAEEEGLPAAAGSPPEMLLFLDATVRAFAAELREWDGEGFRGRVEGLYGEGRIGDER